MSKIFVQNCPKLSEISIHIFCPKFKYPIFNSLKFWLSMYVSKLLFVATHDQSAGEGTKMLWKTPSNNMTDFNQRFPRLFWKRLQKCFSYLYEGCTPIITPRSNKCQEGRLYMECEKLFYLLQLSFCRTAYPLADKKYD